MRYGTFEFGALTWIGTGEGGGRVNIDGSVLLRDTDSYFCGGVAGIQESEGVIINT